MFRYYLTTTGAKNTTTFLPVISDFTRRLMVFKRNPCKPLMVGCNLKIPRRENESEKFENIKLYTAAKIIILSIERTRAW